MPRGVDQVARGSRMDRPRRTHCTAAGFLSG